MKFLPYERLKISTTLSREEVLKRLENAIEPKQFFRYFGSGTKPYQGHVEGSQFEISRIIGYRNSFLPMIKGNVQREISGCSIYITMHPHIFIMVFMVLWLGGVGGFFVVFLSSIISLLSSGQGITDLSVLSAPAAMFILGYALFWGGFKFESIKSKNFFQELFEAREVEEFGITNPFGKAD